MTDQPGPESAPRAPVVSVVIPTRGSRPELLAQAVGSVLGQTRPPDEIILVIDGPCPSTRGLFDHPAVRFVERTAEDVATARNDGIAAARGDWVCFLDDDDLWHPEFLARALGHVAAEPATRALYAPQWTFSADIALGAELVATDLAGCLRAAALTTPSRDTSYTVVTGRSFDLMLERNRGCISASMARRDALLLAGGFPPGYSCAEDWVMFVNVARYAEWHVLSERLGFYRLHPTNNTTTGALSNGLIAIRAIKAVWQDTERPAPKHRDLVAYGPDYRWMLQGSIWNALRRGRADIALQSYREAREILPRARDRLYAVLPRPITWRWDQRFGLARRIGARVPALPRDERAPRVNAYVLAADPAFIEQSIASYYHLVTKIVVSYDRDGLGWPGTPMDVDGSLRRLRDADVEHKMVFEPARYSRPGQNPFESETIQRQAALDSASQDADWVIQLDTDEIVANPAVFEACLLEAIRDGCDALDYPSRNIYSQVRGRLYLEKSQRLWRVAAAYPGPVAVKAGSVLRLARQTELGKVFHVDFPGRDWSDAFGGLPVSRSIQAKDAICHLSWVRSDAAMDAKAKASGHSNENWLHEGVERWKRNRRHPVRAVLASPFQRSAAAEHLRFTWIVLDGAVHD